MVAANGSQVAAALGAVTLGAWATQQVTASTMARTERNKRDMVAPLLSGAGGMLGAATAGTLGYSIVRAYRLGQLHGIGSAGVTAMRVAGVAGVLGGAALATTPPGDNEAWKRVAGVGLGLTGATLAMAAGTTPGFSNGTWELLATAVGKVVR